MANKIELSPYIIWVALILIVVAFYVGKSSNSSNQNGKGTESISQQDNDASVACFKDLNNKLLKVHDKVEFVDSSSSYSDLANAVNEVKSIADGGTLVGLADGTDCPSI
jgi:hypothetical protein